jgi:hypothetical protein
VVHGRMRILNQNGLVYVWLDIEYSHRKGQVDIADVEDFALSESPVMARLVPSYIGLAGPQGASGVLV